ncbi:MAG: GHMP kinase, partial [Bacteroidota bacterium]
MIIHTYSYPRAALIGNPSDGYFGKTIAFLFRNFQAEVIMYESPELEIIPQERDRSVFRSVRGLYEDVKLYGYYGGIRLLKAAIKRFYEHCRDQQIELPNRNFTIRYQSTIPNRLGL